VEWWEGLDYIIKTVEPIYKMLRFGDQDKKPNMGDVVMAFQEMKHELESYFGSNVSTWNEYKQILDNRIRGVYYGMYVGAGKIVCVLYFEALFTTCIVNLKLDFYFAVACLHPRHAYLMEPTPEMFRSLKDTFQSMTDLQSAVQALQEAEVFRRKHGNFAQEIAMRAVNRPKDKPM
jgi:hypothetical protein